MKCHRECKYLCEIKCQNVPHNHAEFVPRWESLEVISLFFSTTNRWFLTMQILAEGLPLFSFQSP